VAGSGFYEIRLTGWRRVASRTLRMPQVHNVLGWFHCSVPGTRGRLRKLFEPWRWKQG
jgi:flavin reductase (DIM6/NTAB) family NADH-FMN oxidoreductase RutF